MYIPAYAECRDPALLEELVGAHPFGVLVTAEGGLDANHYPFLFDAEAGALWTHLARANPQTAALRAGAPCLAVFSGPDSYVSPALYARRAGHVPTWNYAAVHAECVPELVEDDAGIEDVLRRTVARFDPEWDYALDGDFAARLRAAIVGVKLTVRSLRGKFKLSQNRDPEDRAAVLRAFESRSDDDGRELARYMKRLAAPR
jgi:transcriptional regulator